jgi:phage terminase large subunit-like protein
LENQTSKTSLLELTDAHVLKAIAYCKSIVNGSIPACKFVIQACSRQLDDLARWHGKADAPYFFDEKKAGRICRFIELLPHVKGDKAKVGTGLIVLEGWQCFILTTVFGWYNNATKARRFRHAYTEVPRGNAKSTVTSGIGLYLTTSDDEIGAEVYSAATKKEQARIVFGDARAMMIRNAAFCSRLGVVVNLLGLLQPKSNSKFEPLSRDHGTMDGLNVHGALIDELHAHKDRGIYDVLETGAGKRSNSLIWVITTAGFDVSNICYEQRTYVTQILGRSIEDESYFGVIYTIDDTDDWQDPKIWIKANPNWNVSVNPDHYSQLAHKAMQLLSAQNNFKTKHLNIWCSADQPWINMADWHKCGDPTLDEADFSQDLCFGALDLATKTDIASFVRTYVRWQPKNSQCDKHSDPMLGCNDCFPGLEPHYYFFATNYLPETAITDGRNAQYEGWALEGQLRETPGEVIDFDIVEEDIKETAQKTRLQALVFDPWQAQQLANNMNNEAVPMVELRATVANFSAPMKELEATIKSGRFHHNGSSVLAWMASNVVCHMDAKDNVFPRKPRPEAKIDAIVACIMSLSPAMLQEIPYQDRGFREL